MLAAVKIPMNKTPQKLFVSLLAALLPICAFGQIEWNGSAKDSAWKNAANWSGGKAPTAADQIVVPASNDKLLVTGTENAIAGFKLESGVELTVQPQAVLQSVGGTANPNGLSFIEESGKLTVLGSLLIDQAIYCSDSTVTVSGNGRIGRASGLAFLQATQGVFTLNLEGDQAKIEELFILGGTAQININLVLGPGGMKPINGNILELGEGSVLTVDISKYQVTKDAALKLFSFSELKGKFASVKVIGGTGELKTDSGEITLTKIALKK